MLIPGFFVATSNASNAAAFLRRLSGLTRPVSAPRLSADGRLAAAELLGTDIDLKAELAEVVRKCHDDQGTKLEAGAKIRSWAGVALGRLGDPRDAVMHVNAMRLCVVPAGPFCMGSQEVKTYGDRSPASPNEDAPYTYAIGEHQITNPQFQEFYADHGYESEAWWTVARDEGIWKGERIFRRVHSTDQEDVGTLTFGVDEGATRPPNFGSWFSLPNNPVVGIIWHEALAFTKWLTDRWQHEGWLTQSQAVRLPNEFEWEKAAQGGAMIPEAPLIVPASLIGAQMVMEPRLKMNAEPWRQYPYLGVTPSKMFNTKPTGMGATSACGAFPCAASVYGCQDLSGNVWDYTRSAWGPWNGESLGIENAYDIRSFAGDGREAEDLGRDISRVLRGGSYNDEARYARFVFRVRFHPDDGACNFGFRVVVSPFPTFGDEPSGRSPPVGRAGRQEARNDKTMTAKTTGPCESVFARNPLPRMET